MRSLLLGLGLVVSLSIGCGQTGFVALSEPSPAQSPASPLPIYVGRDIGRPYQILGYVFRSTGGHKSGLKKLDDRMYVLTHTSEEMTELRKMALARGADAVVGLEMFPLLGGWGQPIGFSVGGLAVKFTGPQQSSEDAAQASSPQAGTQSTLGSLTPDVHAKQAPLEEPESAPQLNPTPPVASDRLTEPAPLPPSEQAHSF